MFHDKNEMLTACQADLKIGKKIFGKVSPSSKKFYHGLKTTAFFLPFANDLLMTLRSQNIYYLLKTIKSYHTPTSANTDR